MTVLRYECAHFIGEVQSSSQSPSESVILLLLKSRANLWSDLGILRSDGNLGSTDLKLTVVHIGVCPWIWDTTIPVQGDTFFVSLPSAEHRGLTMGTCFWTCSLWVILNYFWKLLLSSYLNRKIPFIVLYTTCLFSLLKNLRCSWINPKQLLLVVMPENRNLVLINTSFCRPQV